MPVITSDEILMAVFGNEVKEIIDEVSTWLLNQIKMSVDANVYSYPKGEYERLEENGGFLGSWEKEAVVFTGNYITTKIFSNPDSMVYNPSKHQHGNLVEDRRANMAEYIEMGTGYDFGGNAQVQRDFWTPIVELIDSGALDEALETRMRAHGLTFIKNI